MNRNSDSADGAPEAMALPLLVLGGRCLFPGQILSLHLRSEYAVRVAEMALAPNAPAAAEVLVVSSAPKAVASQRDGTGPGAARASVLEVVRKENVLGYWRTNSPEEHQERLPGALPIVYAVGCVARVRELVALASGGFRAVLCGTRRARLGRVSDAPFLTARCGPLPAGPRASGASVSELRRAASAALSAFGDDGASQREWATLSSAPFSLSCEDFADLLSAALTAARALPFEVQQLLLERADGAARVAAILKVCDAAVAAAKGHGAVDAAEAQRRSGAVLWRRAPSESIQRLLRERGRPREAEGGEGASSSEDEGDEIDELKAKVKALSLSSEAEKSVRRDLRRLKRLPPQQPEHGVLRGYLETVVSLPWNAETPGAERNSAKDLRRVLDEEHFGLEDVKDRIEAFFAVRQLQRARLQLQSAGEEAGAEAGGEPRGAPVTILCLAGPPGVGKTSIAKSIARSLGRKLCSVALGGVADEAELRGHRRTYVGAMCGRVLSALAGVGVKDPVMLLDEVDKLGARQMGRSLGDPSSALLEILDPMQNRTFTDRYLNLPFDLSKVLFIATANDLAAIPPPLLDRLEVLRLSGYSLDHKVAIARRHLLPRQLRAAGLRPCNLDLDAAALEGAVAGYTREAGVRQLERVVGALCRHAAQKMLERGPPSEVVASSDAVRVAASDLEAVLGPPPFAPADALWQGAPPRPGVATGLAWTPTGGELLLIEAQETPGGAGRLTMTGSLGGVMRESVTIALSYIKANEDAIARLLDRPPALEDAAPRSAAHPPRAWAERHPAARALMMPLSARGEALQDLAERRVDLHVHVPAGGTPKDGPSAGSALLVALVSLLHGAHVDRSVALTGELTLHGRILPVGGVPQKLLAAQRAGIRTAIVPRGNEGDVRRMGKALGADMDIVFADDAMKVLATAFPAKGRWPAKL